MLVVTVGAARWHPLHTTMTTVTYDAQSKRATAVVRVFASDLDVAVARRWGLRQTASRAPLAIPDATRFAYLNSVFSIGTREGHTVPLAWCGSRSTGDLLWVCVQIVAPGGLSGLRVRNAALAELFDDQVNVVTVEYGGRRESLLFTKGDGAKTLP